VSEPAPVLAGLSFGADVEHLMLRSHATPTALRHDRRAHRGSPFPVGKVTVTEGGVGYLTDTLQASGSGGGTRPPPNPFEDPRVVAFTQNPFRSPDAIEGAKEAARRRKEEPRSPVERYAELVNSNAPWSWAEDIGANLTRAQRRAIREEAVARGLVPSVPYKPGTKFADFEAAGLVQRVDHLPEALWHASDAKQFAWLDARIPGGRPPGTTWHHSEIPGRMELVPFGPHNITPPPRRTVARYVGSTTIGVAEVEFEAGTAMPAPHESRVRQFERSWGVRLPASLRRLLLFSNGAVPTRRNFRQSNRRRSLERLLPLLDDPTAARCDGWYDISVVISQIEDRLIEDPNMTGTDVVPIGALFGGDFVCLSYRDGTDEPTVVVWDHERSEEGAPHFEQVAENLEGFLAKLSSDEQPE
jgi:hypothetical protein